MKKKILFSITNLIGGGAEKILLDTVKAMDKTKYDVYAVSYTHLKVNLILDSTHTNASINISHLEKN